MTCLLFEQNLMWSVRLRKTLEFCGYQVTLITQPSQLAEPAQTKADLAILNLAASEWDFAVLVAQLHEAGTKVVAHAGHKEKELHELGRTIGCDLLLTNSEITHKLPQALEKLKP